MNEEIYTKLVDNYFKYALVFFRPKGEVDRKMFTNQEAQLIFNDIGKNLFNMKKNTNNLHLKLLIDKLLKQMQKTDRNWEKKEQLKTIETYEKIIKYIPFTNFCEMLSIDYDITNDDDYIEIKINDELVYSGFDKVEEIQVQFCNVENSAFDLKEILTKNFEEIFQATKIKMEKRKEEK